MIFNFVRKLNPFNKTTEVATERSSYFPPSFDHPYNPDFLFKKSMSYDLFDECLRDDVVNALMEYKLNLILGSGYYVESDNDDIREFWDVALNDEYVGSFQQTLRKMLSCLVYGYSITEKVYKSITLNGKEYWGIKFLKARPPHNFILETDDYGNLIKVIQQENALKTAEGLNAEDFILFPYRPRFENPYGQSDITTGIYRAVVAKKSIIKFMLIAAERYAQPMIVGTHSDLAAPSEVDTFFDILNNLSAKAVMTKTEKYAVDLLESKNSGNIGASYIGILNFLNLSIARGLGVSDLLGMSGQQMSGGGLGGGLGDVQFKNMMEIFKRIREELISLINRHLVYPLTRFNFGNDSYAEFKIEDLSSDDKFKAADMLLKYLEKGQAINVEQRKWFFDSLGIPVGESDEKGDPGAEPGEIDDEIPPEIDDIPEELPQDKIENTFSWDDKKAPNYRQLSLSEKRVNFAEINDKTIEIADVYTGRMDKAIKNSLRAFYEFIRSRKIIENKKFPLLKQLKLTGLGELKSVFADMLDESLKYGISETKRELKDEFKATSSALGIEIAARPIVNAWKQSRILWLTRNVSDEVIKKAEVQLADAMLKGAGVKETIRQLDTSLESTLGKARLQTITRTNVMSAFNQGRLQATKTVPGIIGMQWTAILDDRTSDICSALDGKIFRPNEVNDYPMPAHYNCRSIWVSVFGEDAEGKSESEIYTPPPAVEKKDGFMNLIPKEK